MTQKMTFQRIHGKLGYGGDVCGDLEHGRAGKMMQKRMRKVVCGFVLLAGLSMVGTMPVVAADESNVDVNSPDAMKVALEQ